VSQQGVVDELQRLGMSGYEAKAYVALVASGTPLNGYEVAKRSGVPRSTVYETLAKLVGRGAAYEVRAGEDAVGYIALPPSALLDRLRREFDQSIDVLSAALPELAAPPQVRGPGRSCPISIDRNAVMMGVRARNRLASPARVRSSPRMKHIW